MSSRFKQLYEDTPGGLYLRHLREHVYHFIKWDDMDDACGRDNEGQPRYCAELKEIDVDIVTNSQIAETIESCSRGTLCDENDESFFNGFARPGVPGMDATDAEKKIIWSEQRRWDQENTRLAVKAWRRGAKIFVDGGLNPFSYTKECFVEDAAWYGLGAPLWNDCSNNLKKLMAEAKRESRALEGDASLYEERMNKPVNQLGSTAREYGQGDMQSALARGIKSGSTDARIMGKMYGLSDVAMEEFREKGTVNMVGRVFRVDHGKMRRENIDDPLAYAVGFMDAVAGRGKPATDEREGGGLAEAYLGGYREGVACKSGDQKWPEWIR